MHIPCFVTNTTLSSPSVNLTSINSSSSFNVIASNPVFLAELYSVSAVFFIKPFLVANNKYFPSAKFCIGIIVEIFSPESKLNKFTIAVPFAVLPDSGISYPLNLYSFPLLLKNNIVSCVEAVNISFTKSSSLVDIPVMPLPPRFWLLYVSIGILLIYPKCVNAITLCSSFIKSSTSISPSAAIIFVFLSSPNFSFTSISSSLII